MSTEPKRPWGYALAKATLGDAQQTIRCGYVYETPKGFNVEVLGLPRLAGDPAARVFVQLVRSDK